MLKGFLCFSALYASMRQGNTKGHQLRDKKIGGGALENAQKAKLKWTEGKKMLERAGILAREVGTVPNCGYTCKMMLQKEYFILR